MSEIEEGRQAKVFKALGDPTRLKIIEMLMKGELCVCKIIPATGKSQPTVSSHLKILYEADLVRHRKEGMNIFYRLADDRIREILSISKKMTKERR